MEHMPAASGGITRALGFALSLAAVAAAFMIFVPRTPPSLLAGDAGEFQLLSGNLGLMHPTGYPLGIFLGHAIATVLPFGTILQRVNLLSPVYAAMACGLAELIISRSVSGVPGLLGGVVAVLCLLTSKTFWYVSILPEAYALQLLGTLCVAGLLVMAPRPATVAAGALCGVLFGNHMLTVALTAAALAAALLGAREPRTVAATCSRFAIGLVGGAAVTVTLFWLLWRRACPIDYLHTVIVPNRSMFGLETPRRFWQEWRLEAFALPSSKYFATLTAPKWWALGSLAFVARLCEELSGVGVCLAAVGLAFRFPGEALVGRRAKVLWSALALLQAGLAGLYPVPKASLYFVLAVLSGAMLAGYGAAQLATRVRTGAGSEAVGSVALVVLCVGLAATGAGVATVQCARATLSLLEATDHVSAVALRDLFRAPDSYADLSGGWGVRAAADRFAQVVPAKALVLTDWYYLYPSIYSLADRGVEVVEAFPYDTPRLSDTLHGRLIGPRDRPTFVIGVDVATKLQDEFTLTPRGAGIWSLGE